MGKNYSSDIYKRTYDGDYVKSYSKDSAQRKLLDERRREYDTISKKVNDRPYSKSEKESYDGLQNTSSESDGRVKAEGERRTGQVPRPLQQVPSFNRTTSADRVVDGSQKASATRKEEAPPPYIPKKKSEQDDYSYIDPDSDQPPVSHLPEGKYCNSYNKKIISENEARRLLERAGYYPKKGLSLLLFLLVCAIAFPLKIIGPAILLIWGVSKQKTANTVYQKNVNGVKYAFHMPATTEQQAEQSKQGMQFIIASAFIFVIQMIVL